MGFKIWMIYLPNLLFFMCTYIYIYIIIRVFCPRACPSLQAKEPRLQFCRRQVFHHKLRNQAAVLPGMNRCSSFPLLFAPHSLFSIWTDLKRSERSRRVDLANWVLRISPKFTTRVKYQFHQGFRPDQRSGNPNHPSPLYIQYNLYSIIYGGEWWLGFPDLWCPHLHVGAPGIFSDRF